MKQDGEYPQQGQDEQMEYDNYIGSMEDVYATTTRDVKAEVKPKGGEPKK